MTLYAFAIDTPGHSNCSGSCAVYWPPVPGSDAPHGSVAAVNAKFGTIKRSDGSTQLTVDGYPMYTYAGDSAPGQANGQGKNLSGGLWWVVGPDGSWVKTTGGSSSTPSGAGAATDRPSDGLAGKFPDLGYTSGAAGACPAGPPYDPTDDVSRQPADQRSQGYRGARWERCHD